MNRLFRTTTVYRSIRAEAERGEYPHAVLAVFSDEVCLRAFLRECAKAFFSAEDGSRAEQLIEKESFSDCLFFPEEGKKLSAADCGRVVEETMLLPVEGERKLIVLDDFHHASAAVQNKLLKVLEEPPENVSFLLGAQSEYPILPTVLSRVRKFTVPPFAEEAVALALKRKYPSAEEARCREAAAACGGKFSAAEKALTDGGEEFTLAERFLSLEESEKFCREAAEFPNKEGLLSAIGSVLRDVMFLSAGKGEHAFRKNAAVRALAREYPAGAAIAALELCREAEKQLRYNANFASCLYSFALGVKEVKRKWQRLS